MRLTFARLLAEAWATLRRDADLVLRVAAPLLFLPTYAVLLLCDPLPPLPPAPRDQALIAAWIDAVGVWGQSNAIWYILGDGVGVIGTAALALLLVGPGRPILGDALRDAARRFLPFLLLTLLVAIPVGLGMWLFVLPGLWVQGRLVTALPLLAHDRSASVPEALRRAWRQTRGHSYALMTAILTAFLVQWLTVLPLLSADDWLRVPGRGNPAVLALVDGGIAAVGAAYHLAVLLIGVAAYRRLASSGT